MTRIRITMLIAVASLLLGSAATCDHPSANAPGTRGQEPMKTRIELSSDGGFTGRGVGGVVIAESEVDASDGARVCHGGLTDEERAVLSELMHSTTPAQWQAGYGPADLPHGHPDQIRYTLRLKDHSTSWYGEPPSDLPVDLRRLIPVVSKVRERVLAECR